MHQRESLAFTRSFYVLGVYTGFHRRRIVHLESQKLKSELTITLLNLFSHIRSDEGFLTLTTLLTSELEGHESNQPTSCFSKRAYRPSHRDPVLATPVNVGHRGAHALNDREIACALDLGRAQGEVLARHPGRVGRQDEPAQVHGVSVHL